MDSVILGNTLLKYAIAFGIFAGGSFIVWMFSTVILIKLKKMAEKTETTVDDFVISVLQKVITPVLYLASFYIAVNNLYMADIARVIINKGTIVLITYFGIQAAIMLVDYIVTEVMTKKDSDETRVKSVKGLMVLVKGLIWLIGIILLLDNMGYKVSTIVAGLGIGGIAVALAAQAVLGDLFSYISIIFDKPFQSGDFITVDGYMGTVENIGIKTTRIRSIDGEEIIFSNSNLTSSRIKNFKRLISRRVVMTLGVTYQTPIEKMKKIPEMIKRIITGVKGAAFDRAHFNNFGASSQDFEVVYLVQGNDYIQFMDIKQEINYKIAEEFAKLGVDFAYPTQTVFLNK